METTKSLAVKVSDVKKDNWENLTFKGNGTEYKISSKNVQYHPDIQDGNSVVLHFAMSSFGKEYIHKSELMDASKIPNAPTQAPTQAPRPTKDSREQSIEKQVSLKCAVELCIAGKIELNEITKYAGTFESYLN
jgi:hypothetical protein